MKPPYLIGPIGSVISGVLNKEGRGSAGVVAKITGLYIDHTGLRPIKLQRYSGF
jgi:hypothetical protein